MVNDMQQRLREELAGIDSAGLRRRLHQLDSAQGVRINLEGRELLNFSSNDYLGLANDPILKRAASKAIEEFGAGSGSARLICGFPVVTQLPWESCRSWWVKGIP